MVGKSVSWMWRETFRSAPRYAGWSPGQLEAELSEGAWWTLEGEVADLLSDTPSELWRTVVRRQTNQVALFAGFPDHPRLN